METIEERRKNMNNINNPSIDSKSDEEEDKISEEMYSPEIGLLKCFVENEIIIFCHKKLLNS